MVNLLQGGSFQLAQEIFSQEALYLSQVFILTQPIQLLPRLLMVTLVVHLAAALAQTKRQILGGELILVLPR